jgi:hypothetical protein
MLAVYTRFVLDPESEAPFLSGTFNQIDYTETVDKKEQVETMEIVRKKAKQYLQDTYGCVRVYIHSQDMPKYMLSNKDKYFVDMLGMGYVVNRKRKPIE